MRPSSPRLESYRKSFGRQEIVTPRRGHRQESFAAAKGQLPYNAPLSNFGYGGMLTATALVGSMAARVKGKLLYDSTKLRFTDSKEADKLLAHKPRDGWYL